ncbi:MAG TPA: hypothetical protein VK273_01230 [Gaiellaceae bacterium]|nr:hypothetical protein [Gaiellaceae bacterium]
MSIRTALRLEPDEQVTAADGPAPPAPGELSGVRLPYQARVVLKALKRYGMIVADNGSSWYLTGAPNPGWDNDQLHTLGKVKGSDFRVVDTRGFTSG